GAHSEGPVGLLPNPTRYVVRLKRGRAHYDPAYEVVAIDGKRQRVISHGNLSKAEAEYYAREAAQLRSYTEQLARRNPLPVDEWDVDDEDEAFALGTQQARALGRSAREHRARLKYYTGSYYSRQRDKVVSFIRPIAAHSAAEAKAQVKAMVTNEKP